MLNIAPPMHRASSQGKVAKSILPGGKVDSGIDWAGGTQINVSLLRKDDHIGLNRNSALLHIAPPMHRLSSVDKVVMSKVILMRKNKSGLLTEG